MSKLEASEIEALAREADKITVRIPLTPVEIEKLKAVKSLEEYKYIPRLTLSKIIYNARTLKGLSPVERSVKSIEATLRKIDESTY